jgi:hypothetical protein
MLILLLSPCSYDVQFRFRYGVSTQDAAFKAELCDLYAR